DPGLLQSGNRRRSVGVAPPRNHRPKLPGSEAPRGHLHPRRPVPKLPGRTPGGKALRADGLRGQREAGDLRRPLRARRSPARGGAREARTTRPRGPGQRQREEEGRGSEPERPQPAPGQDRPPPPDAFSPRPRAQQVPRRLRREGAAALGLDGKPELDQDGAVHQANNSVLIDDPDLAHEYRSQWDRLKDAGSVTPETLKRSNNRPRDLKVAGTPARLWFTPTIGLVDLEEARRIVAGAKRAILFLMFNPGPKETLLNQIISTARA